MNTFLTIILIVLIVLCIKEVVVLFLDGWWRGH